MAKKISQLTQATEVKSDDVTVIVQDGETKKLPLNTMVTKKDIENKKIAGLAKLDEIETTYENDTYTPTITVKNKSSVKTGEGDEVDYSANVMDGHAKSAILKGNTLVNLSEINKFSISGRDTKKSTSLKMMKDNAFYTRIVYITKNTLTGVNVNNNVAQTIGLNTDNALFNIDRQIALNETGLVCKECINSGDLSSKSSASHIRVFSVNTGGVLEGYEIIVEGDYTNVDIPYFEGMQSVKMPFLYTVGKNLFDGEIEEGQFDLNGNPSDYAGRTRSKNFIKVPKNTDLYISIGGANNASWTTIYFYNDKKEYTGIINTLDTNKTFNTGNNSYIKWKNNSPMSQITNIQIEQGSVATSYEPYKSNILTVNEDVELRGIGDVKDELDCLTGEVTERIGEIVLDGSENWINYPNGTQENVISFMMNNLDNKRYGVAICDKLKIFATLVIGNGSNAEGIVSGTGDTGLTVYISKDKVTNIETFKQWLSQNPVTVQYQLETESIKTVDLMPSGTHPSTTPYCWKNGHIQLSSSGLLPSLEYSVVTSRAGQISQNATMIVKNDKRIFDLEILLAGGLVNTTYQALTLQNQVETGLSKVSLSSETEPDYLLYHMIMKLIEEKAYKLDDLTEKVSVFYLYEKLSDEQFETIYSALYPFVEDEIVEEPVVEELPEVVEDEVIM